MLLSSVPHGREPSTQQQKVLCGFALEKLLQSGSFGDENLRSQRGVSFLQSLQLLCTPTGGSIVRQQPFSTNAAEPTTAEIRALLCKLGCCIPESFTASIPFAAFLALAYILLVDDGENYASPEYLRRANQLCQQSELQTTLALIAVCCFQATSLERLLQRLRDSGCPLDAGTPSRSATLLIEETRKKQEHERFGGLLPHGLENPIEDPNKGNIQFRAGQATPLSILVAKNYLDCLKILLKLGSHTDSVSCCLLNILLIYYSIPLMELVSSPMQVLQGYSIFYRNYQDMSIHANCQAPWEGVRSGLVRNPS